MLAGPGKFSAGKEAFDTGVEQNGYKIQRIAAWSARCLPLFDAAAYQEARELTEQRDLKLAEMRRSRESLPTAPRR
jgi:hypothetical protein